MDETYTKLCQIFPVLEANSLLALQLPDSSQNPDYDLIINELKSLDIFDVIVDLVRLGSEQLLRHQVVPRFWANFAIDKNLEDGNFIKFETAVLELYQQYNAFVEVMRRLESFKAAGGMAKGHQDEKSGFDTSFKCTLLSQLPVGFEKLVDAFYGKSFSVFAGLAEGNWHRKISGVRNVCVLLQITTKNWKSLLVCVRRVKCHPVVVNARNWLRPLRKLMLDYWKWEFLTGLLDLPSQR